MLRFYEKEFDMEIPRNKANHRYYTHLEIEKFLSIKSLKERGLSLSQIKEVLKSPEILLSETEVAVTTNSSVTNSDYYNSQHVNLQEVKGIIENGIEKNIQHLNEKLLLNIKNLLDTYYLDKNENDDKDALISEVARLRMKLKEKSYETAQLRDQLKKIQYKQGFLSRIFNRE